jgi:hypothetical protein
MITLGQDGYPTQGTPYHKKLRMFQSTVGNGQYGPRLLVLISDYWYDYGYCAGVELENLRHRLLFLGRLPSNWPINVAFVIITGPEREGSRADSDVHDFRRRGRFRSFRVGILALCLGEGAAYKPQMSEISPDTPQEGNQAAEGAMQA